jgi:hypothetical protein
MKGAKHMVTWAEAFELIADLVNSSDQEDGPFLMVAADTQSVPPNLKVFWRETEDDEWVPVLPQGYVTAPVASTPPIDDTTDG